MKFRCRIGREGLNNLLGVTNTLSKLSDNGTGIIILSPDSMRFSVISAEESTGNARSYAELSHACLLSEVRIESQSGNVIAFQLSLVLLAKALSSGKQAPWSILKLTKRGDLSCLTFESSSADLLTCDISHDLAVKILHVSELASVQPPPLSPPRVALHLPSGKVFKSLLDRLSRFGRVLQLTAQQVGRLSLSVQGTTSTLNIRSFIHNLKAVELEGAADDDENENRHVKMRVVLRYFAALLDWHHLPCAQAILFMSSSQEPLLIYLPLLPEGLGSVSFYLPSLPAEDGDDENEENAEEGA